MLIVRWIVAAHVWCALVPALFATEPVMRNLDVRGLRIGGTTTLTIDGDDFGKAPRLLLPFAAKQVLKPGSTDKKCSYDVTLDGEVTPGYHHLRVVTEDGISLPIVIGVDRLPQQAVTVPVTDLPIALHGAVAGGAIIETKFQGKAKQKVIVEVEGQRLGGKLRPILHLYSPKNLQLAWSWAMPALHGDTRLEAILPEDGSYTVTLHDVEYAAAAPGFFRLKIGEWSYVDQVFPPMVGRDKATSVELIGPAVPMQMVANPPKGMDVLPLGWPKATIWSGPQPFVTVSPHLEFVEQPTKDKLQEIPPGLVGVSGRLLTPYEEDRYRIAVTPGKKVRLEVFAERIGSPLDAALVVRNDQGDQLARAEDSPGTLDPVLEYTVPDKVTSIVVGVVDAQGTGSRRGIYRLVIDPQTPNNDGFKLSTTMQRISLPIGGRLVVPVFVERRGYPGKIDLTATMPASVKASGTTIPAGADGALVTLERADSAFEPVVISWRGRNDAGSETSIVLKGHLLERLQPWLATEFALAATKEKAADFVVDWRDLPTDATLVPGSKLALPIKMVRTNVKTSVKLTLLTSQVTPLVNNLPDPNKSIRQEKPVEVPVNMPNGDLTVLIPVELSSPIYDVTVQAELLAADKKVLATAYTPVRRMGVRLPLVVKLDGPSRVETSYDAKKGAVVKLQGKIERIAGLKADVLLAVTGLPAGAKADAVTVTADKTDFVINVTFPPTVAAGEFNAVKVSGSFAPDPKTPAVRVRSREVDVSIVLKAPAK